MVPERRSERWTKGLFTQLLEECRNGQSTYDLLGGLFRQMNSRQPAKAGRYQKV